MAPFLCETNTNEGDRTMFCKQCGAKLQDDARFCGACGTIVSRNEELGHYPIPKWIYYALAGVLVLWMISLIHFPQNLKNYRAVEQAEERADQGYIYSTLNDLDAIAEQNSSSIDVPVKMVDIAMEHGYYDYASYAISTYLEGKEVSDSVYSRMNHYMTVLERYYNTYDTFEEMSANVTGTAPEDSDAVSRKIVAELEALLTDINYDRATVLYYMGYTELDDAKRCEYFENCYQTDPTYTDAKVQVANYYRRQGNLVKARTLLEDAYEEDKEFPSVIRSQAVLEMLEENYTKALSLAQAAYDMNPDEYYVADTYIIATAANGDVEGAKTMKADLEGDGYGFDEELNQFLNGECTLEDYYIH